MNIEKNIIVLLKENSRYTNEHIAKSLNVSEGTIRNKIRKLVESKEIKKFTIKTSSDTSAICMISTDAKIKTKEIIDKIQEIKGIESIYEVSGDYTIICKVSGINLSDINNAIENIRSIEGVIDTNTHTILNEI